MHSSKRFRMSLIEVPELVKAARQQLERPESLKLCTRHFGRSEDVRGRKFGTNQNKKYFYRSTCQPPEISTNIAQYSYRIHFFSHDSQKLSRLEPLVATLLPLNNFDSKKSSSTVATTVMGALLGMGCASERKK